ncbi:UNVERIFIED_CONTAM: F-box protein SKIP1 [Sesamum angustifolium]|uniref:F-box protein SKIP1 n=1 Tax=Sesamum angustifolium TaxID=2727405 RepID=A0AAW2J4B1_9LAMI
MDDEDNKDAAETERCAAADWAELTHECLINIFSRLSLQDRWRGAMRVCKGWHEVCKDPCLNSVLDLECHFDSTPELPRFWTPEFERKIDNMLESVVVWSAGSLTEIRVRHCSDRSLSLVAQRCPNLEVLSIKSSPHVTDAIMAEIASGCPKIKELNISYCYEISHKTLAIIGSHCPNIYMLKRNYELDGDSEAAAISKFMPHLLHLELRFPKLTAKGLTLISEACENLEYLDLSGCANVTSRDIATASSNLKKLKTIKKPNFYIPRSVFHTEGMVIGDCMISDFKRMCSEFDWTAGIRTKGQKDCEITKGWMMCVHLQEPYYRAGSSSYLSIYSDGAAKALICQLKFKSSELIQDQLQKSRNPSLKDYFCSKFNINSLGMHEYSFEA